MTTLKDIHRLEAEIDSLVLQYENATDEYLKEILQSQIDELDSKLTKAKADAPGA